MEIGLPTFLRDVLPVTGDDPTRSENVYFFRASTTSETTANNKRTCLPLHPCLVELKTVPRDEPPVSGNLVHAERIKSARSNFKTKPDAQQATPSALLGLANLSVFCIASENKCIFKP